jgi:Tol biopolymer transport system component
MRYLVLGGGNRRPTSKQEQSPMLRKLTTIFVSLILTTAVVDAEPDGAVKRVEPAAGEEPFLSNVRQLTSTEMGFINAGEAYFSPDARTVIFQATPLGKEEYQIFTMDLRTGKPKMVSTGRGACTCAYFHPTGEKIIFASSHLDPNADNPAARDDSGGYKWFFNDYMDIFEADPDGSNLRRLTTAEGYDAEGSYSPDGKQIVFTSKRDGDLEIYVMNADGKSPRRLTYGEGYDGGPFFSPDGKTILYRGDRRNDGKMNLQLRIVHADGTDDRTLTDNAVFNWCPYWYPSGKSFVFTRADHEAWSKGERPNYDLFLMSADGTKELRVTRDPEFDGLPVFSPDGKQLMWTSKRGPLTEPQIFIADFKLPEGWN